MDDTKRFDPIIQNPAALTTPSVTRAVHIELVEEMSSSAFINAVIRFTSVRGKVKIFRSDRGTNFVGAVDDLKIDCRYWYQRSGIYDCTYLSHEGGQHVVC
jgi:hypothetical protein